MKALRLRNGGEQSARAAEDVANASSVPADWQPRSVMLWLPIALAAGIWIYFALPREPQSWLAPLLHGVALLVVWRWRHHGGMLLLAAVLAGFATAKLRTDSLAAPLLTARTGEVLVVGVVEQITVRSPARRDIVLAIEQVEGLTPDKMPGRLRITLYKAGEGAGVGNRISLKARLSPVPGPAMPGGFDYGRQLYFSSIGGTGRSTGDLRILGEVKTLRLQLLRLLHDVRAGISRRIAENLPPEEATVAAALISGDRAQIPKETNESLQASGLAHILSISGLHMSLAAGGMFWLVRALLALSPRLALRYPIKKWAALAALAGGFCYMLLAGGGAATQRSYIMVAIMLFAILVDRTAISLRNLAVAAIVILLLEPESAVEASFQMSFMAVMGLAAFFEWWTGRLRDTGLYQRGLAARATRWLVLAVAASILTSIIAGGLSSIPAAFHFGRVAPYGVLANGLAIPVISLVVMPAALATVIAMPFGMEHWPLQLMGFGLNRVLAISDWVAALPGSALALPQIPVATALLLAAAAICLCLARRSGKAWGLAFLLAAPLAQRMPAPPDILIERTAANVALRNPQGELVFALPRKGSFAANRWLQANGEKASLSEAAGRSGWLCSGDICRATHKGRGIAYVTNDKAVVKDCRDVDVLISAVPLRGRCRSVETRIDRFDVWKRGAHAVQIGNGGLSVTTAAGLSGDRPWVVVPTARVKGHDRTRQ